MKRLLINKRILFERGANPQYCSSEAAGRVENNTCCFSTRAPMAPSLEEYWCPSVAKPAPSFVEGFTPSKLEGLARRLFVLVFFCTVYFTNYTVFAQSISSAELINNAKQYDGKEVVYRGEVVGELMRRPPHAWVNINDGVNAIGIWTSLSLIQDITYAGAYQVRGDIVEVVGIFHRACLEHGGDLDIHARQIVLQEQGKKSLENLDDSKKITAALLLGVLILVWILHLLRRK